MVQSRDVLPKPTIHADLKVKSRTSIKRPFAVPKLQQCGRRYGRCGRHHPATRGGGGDEMQKRKAGYESQPQPPQLLPAPRTTHHPAAPQPTCRTNAHCSVRARVKPTSARPPDLHQHNVLAAPCSAHVLVIVPASHYAISSLATACCTRPGCEHTPPLLHARHALR